MQKGLKTHYHKYDHQKCFVGHSHNAPWHDDIISACEEALPKFALQPWYADDQFEPTKSLRDKVVEMVANARYGLYDLSWWRPDEQSNWRMPQNVLIELGMAIALNRPVLLLRHVENRALGLSLPTCLDSISQRIVEFSGGPTLKHALEERLPQWLDVPPERAWWTRYCLFGERICTYRESYPQIIQCGQKTIGCHIADGQDIDRSDFRSLIEDELGRYSDISFDYLDALLPTAGYDFQLCTYCQIVRSTPFAIYRITPETTAETFIAIGMSIALEKQFKCEIPKFIFTTDVRSIPSLLTGYEVVEAKTTKERQKRLRKFIPMVMRKVRESVWKPEPLPFVELPAYSVEKDEQSKSITYTELLPYFRGIWEKLTPQQQDTLKNNDTHELEIPGLSEKALFHRFIIDNFVAVPFNLTLETVEKALEMLQNPLALGETDLQHLRIVSLRAKPAASTSTERGIVIREVLTEAFERLRGSGYRNDTEPAWQAYNILYYRYFKHHLKNALIIARMEFTSDRQFFRERKKAIEALYNILLEMEQNVP